MTFAYNSFTTNVQNWSFYFEYMYYSTTELHMVQNPKSICQYLTK